MAGSSKVDNFEFTPFRNAERMLEDILQKACDKPRVSQNVAGKWRTARQNFKQNIVQGFAAASPRILSLKASLTGDGADASPQSGTEEPLVTETTISVESPGSAGPTQQDKPVPFFISNPQILLARENAKYRRKTLWNRKGACGSFEELQWVMSKLTQMSNMLESLPVDPFDYFKLYLDLDETTSSFAAVVMSESLKEVVMERFEAVKYLSGMMFDRLQHEYVKEAIDFFNEVLPKCSVDEVLWFQATITKNGASNILQAPVDKTEEGWKYSDDENCKVDLNGFLLMLTIIQSDKLGAEARKVAKWGAGFNARLAFMANIRLWVTQFSALMMSELPKLKDYLDFHIVLCRHQLDIFQNNENNSRTYVLTVLFGILALIATIPSWLTINQ